MWQYQRTMMFHNWLTPQSTHRWRNCSFGACNWRKQSEHRNRYLNCKISVWQRPSMLGISKSPKAKWERKYKIFKFISYTIIYSKSPFHKEIFKVRRIGFIVIRLESSLEEPIQVQMHVYKVSVKRHSLINFKFKLFYNEPYILIFTQFTFGLKNSLIPLPAPSKVTPRINKINNKIYGNVAVK